LLVFSVTAPAASASLTEPQRMGEDADPHRVDALPADPHRAELERVLVAHPELGAAPLALVSIAEQRLHLYRAGVLVRSYPVSTSRHGIGNTLGSLRTPLGVHRVRRKIGAEAPLGTIFRGRRNTGEIAPLVLDPIDHPDDLVTTRILWLDGLEPGVNQGEGIDSFARYIYIHGTHEEGLIGTPASDGCVRMRNADVVELFELMPLDAGVVIVR
jgi:hypothetical protein